MTFFELFNEIKTGLFLLGSAVVLWEMVPALLELLEEGQSDDDEDSDTD